MTSSRLALVDDDDAARTSLGELLMTYGYDVCPFDNGEKFLESCDSGHYRCILLDIRMPGIDGLEVQRRMRQRALFPPIIFITGHGDIPMAVAAMRDGAFDFVEKPIRDEVLIASIERAISGSRSLDDIAGECSAFETHLALLTRREIEVMNLVIAGHSSSSIGAVLGISSRTADHHRARILEKLGLASIANLIRIGALYFGSKR